MQQEVDSEGQVQEVSGGTMDFNGNQTGGHS